MTGRVLVTGASGFVGRDLIGRLVSAGWQVRAAARRVADIPAAEGIERVGMPDLAATVVDWSPLVAGMTHVVHLAGLAHMTTAIAEETYHAVNAEAARALAEASIKAGVRRLVLISSIRAQSGPARQGLVRESDPPEPTEAYGRSKLAGERLATAALTGSATELVVLRPVLVYGPGVKGNMRTLMALAKLPVPLPLGALPGRRSLVSLENLASAVRHALTAATTAGGTFLVADADAVTVAEIVTALRAGAGRSPLLVPVPTAPLALGLRLAGKGAVWDRLAGDLMADTGALLATGWQPAGTTATALAELSRSA